ncbi:MAG: FAD-binding oxidoreductase [Gemmatimonadales bacterium]|nr:FAD-binding oxidoreductase [Gemmatimonadales bacterium]
MSGADVVIVGAGVMGASVAWHLAAMGVRSVRLLDAGPGPGAGSTGRATGGYRAQYASAINVRLSLASRAKLLRFRDETGGDCGYQPVGYLFLAESPAHLAVLREAQQVQHAEGLAEARLLGPTEIAALQPHVALDGVVGAAWCPSDGYIRPMGLLAGYLDAATRAGVAVTWHSPVEALERQGDRLVAVRAGGERIACGAVVNAAGAWAARVAALAGAALPVAPTRRQVAITQPTSTLPPSSPMTIFVGDGFHFRVRDGRVLLLLPEATVGADAFDTTFAPAWLARLRAVTAARVPALAAVPLDEPACWCGLYEMSPDHHAIVGREPGLANLWHLAGSSGHGVMHAPALGDALAQMLVHGEDHRADLAPLRPGRFAAGHPLPAPVLL